MGLQPAGLRSHSVSSGRLPLSPHCTSLTSVSNFKNLDVALAVQELQPARRYKSGRNTSLKWAVDDVANSIVRKKLPRRSITHCVSVEPGYLSALLIAVECLRVMTKKDRRAGY